MYYEEKVIDGVLHWRNDPNGEWIARTSKELTSELQEVKNELDPIMAELYLLRQVVEMQHKASELSKKYFEKFVKE